MHPRNRVEPWYLVGIVIAAIVVSGVSPYDRTIWLLETAPVILLIPAGVWSIRRFELSPTSYRVAALGALLMIIGAHYSYARVPLGEWFQAAFDLERNHYDRFGHFFQGLVPAIIIRDILTRTARLQARLLFLTSLSMTVALSACYELVEFAVHAIGHERVRPFLGAQGDPWDAQWDMLMALCGGLVGLSVFKGAVKGGESR